MKTSIIALVTFLISCFMLQTSQAQTQDQSSDKPFVELFYRNFHKESKATKKMLKQYDLDIACYNVMSSEAKKNEMIVRAKSTEIPQVFIDGVLIGGVEDLEAYISNGKMNAPATLTTR